MKRIILSFALLVLSFSLFGKGAQEESLYLASKTPYPSPAEISVTAPPAGYEPSFIFTVNRHGSRSLSGFKYDKGWLDMLADADSRGALLDEGRKLWEDIKVIAAFEEGKYGLLTQLGKDELYGIGSRVGDVYGEMLTNDTLIRAEATYKERTQESRDSFLSGLVSAGYKGNADIMAYDKKKDPYLRPMDLATNYNRFLDEGDWNDYLTAFRETPEASAMSYRICSQFFTDEYLKLLDSGELKFYKEGGEDVVINSVATAGSCLFELYIILPSLREDGFEGMNLRKYFTDEELAMYQEVQGGKNFFKYGAGRPEYNNISLNILAPLAKRFINETDLYLSGESPYKGVFLFAHAETVVPMEGFMEIEGSNKAYSDLSEALENWHGYYYGPMGANLQFILFTSEEGEPLVKVMLNERESTLSPSLEPVEGPYYSWNEVRAFYANKVSTLGIFLDNTLEEDIEALKIKF